MDRISIEVALGTSVIPPVEATQKEVRLIGGGVGAILALLAAW
jgi:hypothetical protein